MAGSVKTSVLPVTPQNNTCGLGHNYMFAGSNLNHGKSQKETHAAAIHQRTGVRIRSSALIFRRLDDFKLWSTVAYAVDMAVCVSDLWAGFN